MKPRKFLISAIAVATLAGGGSAYALAAGDDGGAAPVVSADTRQAGDDDRDDRRDDARDDAGNDDRDDAREDAREARAAKVSAVDAARAAARAVPGTAYSADLDGDGRPVWEVDVRAKDGTWHDVTVDARDGGVVRDRVDEDEDENTASRITLERAANAATRAVPGTVTSIDLDDNGWDVEIAGKDGRHHEVAVDPSTAKATATRDDRDDGGKGDHDDGDGDGDEHGADEHDD
ncbi:hypothetical protein GCM10027168_37950 [Streptomyces capparidis]